MTDPDHALDAFVHLTRPARGEPDGALILMHGRATSEQDLYPLLDVFDPEQRLVGATPRGPLSLPPGGAHWYRILRVGFPDPETFGATYRRLGAWIDTFVAAHGLTHDRLILGGFSQGTVMAYALGLGTGRPAPAGILAMSGFIPTVDGWEPDLAGRNDATRVAIFHGEMDPIIGIDFARTANVTLQNAGFDVLYRVAPVPHTIDPRVVPDLTNWVRETLPPR
jgi:phospholipase/carboxylesterase